MRKLFELSMKLRGGTERRPTVSTSWERMKFLLTILVTVEYLLSFGEVGSGKHQSAAAAALQRRLEQIDLIHIRSLFATKKLAYSTGVMMGVWTFIGLGYPLYNAFIPYIQATKGAQFGHGSTYLTYRNSLIIAVLGVPGALLGGLFVEIPRFGWRGTLAVATVLTGVFLYASTTATTSSVLLGWQCAFNFFQTLCMQSYTATHQRSSQPKIVGLVML